MYSLYTQYLTLDAGPQSSAGLLQAILTTQPTPHPSQKLFK